MKRKTTRSESTKQEERIANNMGGKRVANSGATKFDKGDVISPLWLIEAKTRMEPRASICIRREWLEKLKGEGFSHRRYNTALAISFDNEKDYFVLEDTLFYRLIELQKEEDND